MESTVLLFLLFLGTYFIYIYYCNILNAVFIVELCIFYIIIFLYVGEMLLFINMFCLRTKYRMLSVFHSSSKISTTLYTPLQQLPKSLLLEISFPHPLDACALLCKFGPYETVFW